MSYANQEMVAPDDFPTQSPDITPLFDGKGGWPSPGTQFTPAATASEATSALFDNKGGWVPPPAPSQTFMQKVKARPLLTLSIAGVIGGTIWFIARR